MNFYNIALAFFTMAMSTEAFTVSPTGARTSTHLAASTLASPQNLYFVDEVDVTPPSFQAQQIEAPQPVAPKKRPAAKNSAHKEGLLSPIVQVAKTAMGDQELNKLRGKVIALHSDVIKDFVDTSDSAFGQSVLKSLFVVADADSNGTIEEPELERAFGVLGFDFLKEKQIKGIFKRADLNQDGHIDLEEFMREAPRTLRTSLVKLAKKNGGEMGLLV